MTRTAPRLSLCAAVTLLLGCAGEKAESRRETTTAAASEAPTGAGVTPEQNDAIDALFRRKTPELQSCWTAEYEKTHNRKLEGDVTLGLTVTPSGKPDGVRVLKSSLGNSDVEKCVATTVAGWAFPEVSANCPYLRTVHLGAEF
jgi:TonB family protein